MKHESYQQNKNKNNTNPIQNLKGEQVNRFMNLFIYSVTSLVEK